MTAAGKSSTNEERAIWLVSVLASLVINAALGLTLVTVSALERKGLAPVPHTPAAPDLVVEISPAMLKALAAVTPEVAAPPPTFTQTTPDQQAARPERPGYFGEHDTRATSDAPPVAGALEVPSLAGREPRRDEVQATQSDYQDGEIRPDPAALTKPLAPAPPALAGDPALRPAESSAAAAPVGLETPAAPAETLPEVAGQPVPPAVELLEGPSAVDTPERLETAKVEALVPAAEAPGEQAPAGEELRETPQDKPLSEAQQQAQAKPSLPKPASDPAFRGNQEKTKMQGSISRKGKSALDVADTPLGRYQAQLSRAVELEWQRNCVRYRDLITPGFITVRFFIDAKGKVTTLSFVEVVEVGEVQKGFTVSSIRTAEIPPMPAELARELKGEPLELTFNFYF
jgi:hypothetical protein